VNNNGNTCGEAVMLATAAAVAAAMVVKSVLWDDPELGWSAGSLVMMLLAR
jgi:hypothetical protein